MWTELGHLWGRALHGQRPPVNPLTNQMSRKNCLGSPNNAWHVQLTDSHTAGPCNPHLLRLHSLEAFFNFSLHG